ncbi:inorganic phosphate transporter [bacterium]|nr:inorganic phosphate transporter [bacterium]
MQYLILLTAVLWLAYANGANDNFKGVATLYGCGSARYHTALLWATIATLLGSVVSVMLAEQLVKLFSGAGLLPPSLLGTPGVLISVALATAVTIMLATWLGMPTSTTHALSGALVGIAWSATGSTPEWAAFLRLFAFPLLLSPILAIAITTALYPVLHKLRVAAGITRESCACIDYPDGVGAPQSTPAFAMLPAPRLWGGELPECATRYSGPVLGISAESVAGIAHYLSAGAVCFSRAVNDTPKIAALIIAFAGTSVTPSLALVAAAMAFGGLIQSRRVAETMSKRITPLNQGQGLCANLVTAGLVLFASRFGMPVSTTHVSCGSLFGIGLVQRQAEWRVIAAVLATWATTFPLGAILGALFYGGFCS